MRRFRIPDIFEAITKNFQSTLASAVKALENQLERWALIVQASFREENLSNIPFRGS
jgi:hypothetical protein